MGVRQISTFLQSRPGHLARILELLENAHVSVRGYSVSDTGDFGIGRIIVDDPDTAIEALEAQGIAHTETEVLCLLLHDAPGELARVLRILADHDINITYSYSMISTYIVIKTDDARTAADVLASTDLVLVDQQDIKQANVVRADEGR